MPQITPIRNSSYASVKNKKGQVGKKMTDACLKQVLSGAVHREFEIVDFVKLVYNFTPNDIPKGRAYTLPEQFCQCFCDSKNVLESYEPLEKIFEDLKRQLLRKTVAPPLALNLRSFNETLKGDYSKFSPDFYLSTTTVQEWMTGLGYGEVKRSDTEGGKYRKLPWKGYNIDLDVLMAVGLFGGSSWCSCH